MGILKLGSQGSEVVELQNLLIKKGYKVVADGDFGPNTDKAVKDFQSKNGLTPDGVVGNMTIASLKGEPIETYNSIPESNINIVSYLLHDDEYYKEIYKKTTIYLHHTAGGSRPDYTIQGWENDKGTNGGVLKVGTAFVIGRKSSTTGDQSYDGKIYKAFEPKYYAHHLGTKLANNKELNQKSIGIEICNYGGLTKTKDGKFINYVNKEVSQADVIDLGYVWKGFRYYEAYTDAQIEAIKNLLLELSKNFGINVKQQTKIDSKWFELNDNAIKGLPGLYTHVHVRSDKTDCYPHPKLIDMINSL